MSLYFAGEEQSLEDILKARDMRVQYQQYLLKNHRSTIVSFKLNIPGPVKYNSLIKKIFDEGVSAFKQKCDEFLMTIVKEKIVYEKSGPEYFAVFSVSSNMTLYLIKKLSTYIEETHPLGRLYDFDVLDADGKQLSRSDIGMKPRKCLLCENNAFECGRSRTHEISALIDKIETIALEYFTE